MAAFIFTNVCLGTKNAFAKWVTGVPADAGATWRIISSSRGRIISQVYYTHALCCQDVTITVANLYLRQQLIFDRV